MPHSFFKSCIMVRLVGLIPGCADITHTTVFAAVLQHHREAKEALSVSIIQRHIRTVLWIVKMRCNCKSLKGCFFLCVLPFLCIFQMHSVMEDVLSGRKNTQETQYFCVQHLNYLAGHILESYMYCSIGRR